MSSPVQGFWTLQSWVRIREDGACEPYSLQPLGGFLFYAAEGTMAVSIYERNEPRLLTSYAGRYEYAAGEVIHQPIEGSSPRGIRDKKIRRVQFEQDRMIMETPTDRLVWQRHGGP